jgi:hypothetical protein
LDDVPEGYEPGVQWSSVMQAGLSGWIQVNEMMFCTPDETTHPFTEAVRQSTAPKEL